MLPRLLFVMGMTVGVMTPLVWAAYVSIPASGTLAQRSPDWGRSGIVGAALLEPIKARLISRAASTASSTGTVPPAAISDRPEPKSDLTSAAASLSSEKAKAVAPAEVTSTASFASADEKTLQGAHPPDARDASRAGETPTGSNGARPRQMADRAPMRDVPDVVDLYSGPHVIVVCSELTKLQKLRMGCR